MAEEKYLVNPETGSRFRVGGCLVSDEPSDLPKFGAVRFLASKSLPPAVDLRQLMTPIEHQEHINSCVGNALAGAYEFLIMKRTRKHIDVSRLFIYYNGRREGGLQEYNMKDDGTSIVSAIEALAKYGCCKEQSFPYNVAYTNQKPPSQCYAEARNYRITTAMNLRVDLDEMKACLAEGYPFAFGLHLFQSFARAENNGGRVEMPQPHLEPSAGWHAMLAVGYSDPSQGFIVRNSYGVTWGDKGYCYIPYAYMCNPQYCKDLHAIKVVADDVAAQRGKNIHNPYNWNVDKDKTYFVPSDYPYQDFDYKFFWKTNDMFNYFNTIWNNGKATPFVWKMSQSEASSNKDQKAILPKNESPTWFILWIDTMSNDNIHVVNHLKADISVQIEFRETLAEAQNYILTHIDKSRSSSTFLIICRGYYRGENKNPLNLLHFLNYHGLNQIPVFVFTEDKSGVQYHLQNQAPSMNITDWEQRLTITSTSENLIKKLKRKMTNKH